MPRVLIARGGAVGVDRIGANWRKAVLDTWTPMVPKFTDAPTACAPLRTDRDSGRMCRAGGDRLGAQFRASDSRRSPQQDVTGTCRAPRPRPRDPAASTRDD